MTPPVTPLVAVINSSQDIVNLLKTVLESEGFRAVTHVGIVSDRPVEFVEFLRRHDPAAVVYSVGLPYAEKWAQFQEVRRQLPACRFIVTTTNRAALESFTGPTESIELIGKPFDLDEIVGAVRRATDPSG